MNHLNHASLRRAAPFVGGAVLLLGAAVALVGPSGDDDARPRAGPPASWRRDADATASEAARPASTASALRPGADAAPAPGPAARGPDGAGEGHGPDGADDADGDHAHGAEGAGDGEPAEGDAGCGGDHEAEAAERTLATLVEGLKADPAALRGALDAFRHVPDRAQVELLGSILGRVRDPAVEAAALEAAGADPEPWRRMAAFDLLDALDTPAALPVALRALAGEPDAEARRAAIHALPMPTGVPTREARAVVAGLTRAARADADPEVRRRAAVALGDWARTAADLLPVADALEGDPSVDVRAGAAFALELARPTDARARAALVAAVQRRDEDPLVRENAWRALGAAGPLADAEHVAWDAYRAERAQ